MYEDDDMEPKDLNDVCDAIEAVESRIEEMNSNEAAPKELVTAVSSVVLLLCGIFVVVLLHVIHHW